MVVSFYFAVVIFCCFMNCLQTLAPQHFETKFAKIDVEKAKFFVNKLKIRVLPAVICFEKGIVIDRLMYLVLLLLLLLLCLITLMK